MSGHATLDGVALDRLARLGGTPLVRQLIELYLAHGPERIDALLTGAAAGDAAAVERAAHTLKSTAGNLGAARLQHTAEEVETLAAAGMIDAALTDRLRVAYDESVAALQRGLRELGP